MPEGLACLRRKLTPSTADDCRGCPLEATGQSSDGLLPPRCTPPHAMATDRDGLAENNAVSGLPTAAAYLRDLDRTLYLSRTTKTALVHLEDVGEAEWAADAIRATANDTEDEIRNMEKDETITNRAIKLLGSQRNDAKPPSVRRMWPWGRKSLSSFLKRSDYIAIGRNCNRSTANHEALLRRIRSPTKA